MNRLQPVNKAKSISKQVNRSLFIAALIIFVVIELMILARSYQALLNVHDVTLQTQADGLASLTDIEVDGSIEFDFEDINFEDFSGHNPEGYFIIYSAADGHEINHSPSLDSLRLSFPELVEKFVFKSPYYWDAKIEKKQVRFIAFRKIIAPDPSEMAESEIDLLSQECIYIVGKDMRDVFEQFFEIFKLTVTALLMGFMILLLIGKYILKINLKQLDDFKEEVKQISSDNLVRVNIPEANEIAVVAHTLNDVIEQLNDAFERERKFTSNVAHELRTPISEIRTLTEVVLKFESNLNEDDRENYADILSSVKQMQNIVNNLLLLTRSDSNSLKCFKEQIDANEIVCESLKLYGSYANDRKIRFANRMTVPFIIETDKHLFKIIIDNLIANCAEYSKENTVVEITGFTITDRFKLSISNAAQNIGHGDLPKMFDRLWRKDKTRSPETGHFGLGLSIVKSIVSFLSLHIKSELNDDSVLTITIESGQRHPQTVK